MIVKAFEFELKDGRRALVRSPEYADIPGVLDYLYKTSGETEFLLRYPEECVKYTPESEKELFDQINAAPNDAMLLCLVDGKVAGNCRITWSSKIKTRHRASIGIALLRDYWNQGIGTRLLTELIRIAEENEGILQMELDFIEGNSRARALYEKMGFRITGMIPNAIRLKNGTLLNEYHMIREIKR
ncbi:MAG: GNAT family N-acetyltransferase [Clostridia bacterium]|nr:GNAT family N-acetyltransferase [Clostridia bacterium]